MLKVKIKPIGERVLVKFGKEIEEQGGILLPDNAREKSQEAEIIAIGTQVHDRELKIGAICLTSKFGGTEIKDGNEIYKIYKTDEILAVIN